MHNFSKKVNMVLILFVIVLVISCEKHEEPKLSLSLGQSVSTKLEGFSYYPKGFDVIFGEEGGFWVFHVQRDQGSKIQGIFYNGSQWGNPQGIASESYFISSWSATMDREGKPIVFWRTY
ncbi:MAG: hypothetical protein GY869_27760 [Planctomycetes bacterium]|nr:hypothetical protein [Planctomycetota bacterium]